MADLGRVGSAVSLSHPCSCQKGGGQGLTEGVVVPLVVRERGR